MSRVEEGIETDRTILGEEMNTDITIEGIVVETTSLVSIEALGGNESISLNRSRMPVTKSSPTGRRLSQNPRSLPSQKRTSKQAVMRP